MQNRYNLKKNCCVIPKFIHIELTERCPLSCPQCYCDLHNGKDLDFSLCKDIIDDIVEFGIHNILLTGGEPLLYPHLHDLIAYAHEHDINCEIATSGVGLSEEKAKSIVEFGNVSIFISINGSTKEIHNLSRACFDEGINAIKVLKKLNIWCGVNWVARKDNVRDFENFVTMCKGLKVDQIVVLACKKTNTGEDYSISKEELLYVADCIKRMSQNEYIGIDGCYPELNELVYGEPVHPIYQSCAAGRLFFDVYADGSFSPCRHIQCKEKYKKVKEYWTQSETLKDIRSNVDAYQRNCRNFNFN